MEYKKEIQLDYANRTIANYNCLKKNAPYKITFQTMTLLALLTALFPDEQNNVVNYDELQDLPWNTINNRDYIMSLRNSLAHKTNDNFIDYSRDKIIDVIQFSSRTGSTIRLNENDLEKIINIFKNVINLK